MEANYNLKGVVSGEISVLKQMFLINQMLQNITEIN